jgi:hypothetical protein
MQYVLLRVPECVVPVVPYPEIGFRPLSIHDSVGFRFRRHWCAGGCEYGECGITSSPGLAPVAGVAVMAGA